MSFDFHHYYTLNASKLFGGEVLPRARQAAQLLERYLEIRGPLRLLDVGCGVGETCIFLSHAIYADEVYGVDIAEELLRLASEKGIRTHQVDLNVQELPFPDSFFDVVHCAEVIEHLVDPDNLLAEISRTLKPKGMCVISTANLASWANRIGLLFFGWQPLTSKITKISFYHDVGRPKSLCTVGHLRVFTKRGLQDLLKCYGFAIIKCLGAPLMVSVARSEAIRERAHGMRAIARTLLLSIAYLVDICVSVVPSLGGEVICPGQKGLFLQKGSRVEETARLLRSLKDLLFPPVLLFAQSAQQHWEWR